MPIDVEDAEAYELPDLDASKAYGEEGILDESERLLNEEESVKARRSSEGQSDDQNDSGGDQQGKGTKIESLIARVHYPLVLDTWADTAQTVPSTDDPSLPTLTARVILLGSFFCILGASASQIFYFKSNAPTFSAYFVILATYPLGHFLANERVILRGKRFLGMGLNPAPFSIKEAILVR
jgi:hypothetical protein